LLFGRRLRLLGEEVGHPRRLSQPLGEADPRAHPRGIELVLDVPEVRPDLRQPVVSLDRVTAEAADLLDDAPPAGQVRRQIDERCTPALVDAHLDDALLFLAFRRRSAFPRRRPQRVWKWHAGARRPTGRHRTGELWRLGAFGVDLALDLR